VKKVSLRALVNMVEEAAGDNRVRGIYARFGANQSFDGLAQVQEIRDAITRYRSPPPPLLVVQEGSPRLRRPSSVVVFVMPPLSV
jgi:hypothetical protein